MNLPIPLRAWFNNTFVHRVAHKCAFALAMLTCVVWSAGQVIQESDPPAPAARFHEWPSSWDGAALRPLALSDVEERFAQHFPGAIARLTDGHQTVVLREVRQPTRMLHPAVDCYRALGWRVEQIRLERDADARLWRCFVTRHDSAQKLRVCERIVDAKGATFTDTSAWYWAAASGESKGPWEAVTLARPIP
ncbi:MAG: hypothetical protein KKC79_05375 [Gammaproteobacteria bacterium]|nr:hypothetical protein [Gammaproteobacteria bacterium]MBU2408066.1 hypothetical protein [Gammaproteobacteria bacterium]